MDIKITLSSKEIYDWVVETARKSYKTLDQFIEDAIWFYKNDIENPENPKKDNIWRFR